MKWLPALQSIACSRLYEACKTDIFAYGEPVLFINGKSQLIVYTSGQKHHHKNITMARETGECLNICNSAFLQCFLSQTFIKYSFIVYPVNLVFNSSVIAAPQML